MCSNVVKCTIRIMFPSKLIWLLNYVCQASYLLHFCLSNAALASYAESEVDFGDLCSPDSSIRSVITYQCGRYLRITRLTEGMALQEGPFYNIATRSLLYVNADESAAEVHNFFIDEGEDYCAKLGDRSVSSITPIRGMPGKYISSYGDEITCLEWDGISSYASFRKIVVPDRVHLWPDNLVNDMKATPYGALVGYVVPQITGEFYKLPRNQSSLFLISNGKVICLQNKITYGNALGYTPDGRCLYHCDTMQNVTWISCFDKGRTHFVSTRVFFNNSKEGVGGSPDSMTIDRHGYVWLACNGGSRIVRIHPTTGKVVFTIIIPVSGVTNCAFGECRNRRTGKLDCLYITTSRQGQVSSSKCDGALFVVEYTGYEGVLPYKADLNAIYGRREYEREDHYP